MNYFEIFVLIGLFTLVAERIIYLVKRFKLFKSKSMDTCAYKSEKGDLDDIDEEKLGTFSWVLLAIAVGSIMFSFLAPMLFTKDVINEKTSFNVTGQIGDTIGGLMNPFIAIAGVIITGLAFYMQYRANKIQRQLFLKGQEASNRQFIQQLEHQQFESQFYEMLRLHKENVNEMELPGKVRNGSGWENLTYTKREVFRQMQLELESLLEFTSYDKTTTLADNFDSTTPLRTIPLTEDQFNQCYKIFFWGFDPYINYELTEESLSDIKNILKDRYPEADGIETMIAIGLRFGIDAYKGHSVRLGHYFRHLFMMVKFVVNSSVLSNYKDKIRYLKILRAQLSNYEQIMLFYNWMSGFGGPWEDNKRQFFTEYCMIHNLWHDQLFKNQLIKDKLIQLTNINAPLRGSNDLFEVGTDFSTFDRKPNNSNSQN